jgi:hypothetical protein
VVMYNDRFLNSNGLVEQIDKFGMSDKAKPVTSMISLSEIKNAYRNIEPVVSI